MRCIDTVAIYLSAVFLAGTLALLVRMPPLVGFLAAGFALNAAGVEELPQLDDLADLGVTLLLFSIGLKLDVRFLLRREVWLTATVHMALSVPLALGVLGGLGALGVGLIADDGFGALLLLGLALSFSSTVLVVKVLEERSESQSLYGRIAIGILIVQDLAAVVFILASERSWPSPWAFALVLLVPLAVPVRRLWSRLGHGEMQALFGVFIALVPGFALFEAVGLKGDVGALAMGLLLAGHPAAFELSRALLSVKDLLLVGFFLSIGFTGELSWATAGLGLALLVLLPVQGWLYMLLLRWARLRRRTSVLTGLTLTQNSEFGLIVVAVGVSAGMLEPHWLVVVSVAVAASFVLSSMVNRRSIDLVPLLTRTLPPLDPATLHPADRYVDLGDAQAVVMGMGRVGTAAYRRLVDAHGLETVGIEHDRNRVRQHTERGFRVLEADASDDEFWQRLADASQVRVAILAMPFHGTNQVALKQLLDSGFRGRIAAVAQYDDDARSLRESGADAVLQIYDGAGSEMADRAVAPRSTS
ncbi:cation:proton antiporter family protein [Nocardioides coralli]|uniref:cation:proton antiporter family protein n=1 Tax=Nocardioides coralli TaxID=2872154 RepID=UPI002016FBC2|nr:cation:proton antiporter family protein [Nocardioides coralli]